MKMLNSTSRNQEKMLLYWKHFVLFIMLIYDLLNMFCYILIEWLVTVYAQAWVVLEIPPICITPITCVIFEILTIRINPIRELWFTDQHLLEGWTWLYLEKKYVVTNLMYINPHLVISWEYSNNWSITLMPTHSF
jgi:hypothetical protein